MFTSAWIKDCAERCVRAFSVAFLGIYVASGLNLASAFTDLSVADKAAGAGIAAAISVILSALAGGVPATVSPASFVKHAGVHWSGPHGPHVPPVG